MSILNNLIFFILTIYFTLKGFYMGKLTKQARDKLSNNEFGMPSKRKYPINDKSHAINAKARATQQAAKGSLSKSMEKKIDAKANRLLSKLKRVRKINKK